MNIYFILVHIVPITLMEVIVVLLALHILVKIRDDKMIKCSLGRGLEYLCS